MKNCIKYNLVLVHLSQTYHSLKRGSDEETTKNRKLRLCIPKVYSHFYVFFMHFNLHLPNDIKRCKAFTKIIYENTSSLITIPQYC